MHKNSRIFTHSRSTSDNIRRSILGPLFWWSITITILGAIAVLSWLLSIYIFNHPNEKIPYKILTKVKKLPPLKKFSLEEPPQTQKGFRRTRVLMEDTFANFQGLHLDFINDILLRDYIENFKRSEGAIYIRGRFVIDYARKLNDTDLFQTGLVFRCHTEDFPKASIEVVFPTTAANDVQLPVIGETINLRSEFFATLIHVNKPTPDSICFTLIPIIYGTMPVSEKQTLKLSPPPLLNIDGKWPLTSSEEAKRS